MATGAKMSYNPYQSGKYGSLPQTSQKDVEVTQDMHLKMSKKIAQLTKVIYALNTKNDENEAVLQALRDQHEEEIQQILADTKRKVAVYKDRLDEESDHLVTIDALQSRIAEFQTQQSSLQDQFSTYKTEMQERQEKERESYASRLFDMSHDVLKAKKVFEEHLERFNSWRDRITAEHATAIAELESKRQTELEELRSFQRNQDDTWLNQCAKIEDKFKSQIEDLKSQIENMELEKGRLNEEYTHKLEKAKAFYEKELEALRTNQTEEYTAEIENLRKEIDRLKSDIGANDKELRVQIDRLVRQLADTEDSLEQSRQQQQVLQAELAGRDSSSSELSKQVRDLTEELAKKTSSLNSVETELAGSKQHCSGLAEELMKKSNTLGELEANNMQKDGIISSIRAELEKLKEQLAKVNAEKMSLMSQQQNLSTEQQGILQSLRQQLEDVIIERETLKERSEKQLLSLKAEMERQEQSMKEDLEKRLQELNGKHTETLERERKVAAEVLVTTKQELKQSHETEMSKVSTERDTLRQELEHLKADLSSKLADAEREVSRLESIVRESEVGLGSASSQLVSLKDAAAQLRAELDKTRTELKSSKANAASLQAELEKLKVLHEGKVTELELALKTRLQDLSAEVDAKWTETMKLECRKLREELTNQKEDEKRAALSQLSRLKDEEIAAVRAGMDNRVEHLKEQIEELQSQVETAKAEGDVERAKWQFELQREKSQLSKEMLEAANEYSHKIAAMEQIHVEELERVKAQMELEKSNLEAELKRKHLEELQAQMTAHRAAVDSANQLGQRQKEEELSKLRAAHQEELEKLRAQLEERGRAEIDALKHAHAAEIRAARMELERAVEISKQKDRDHQIQAEELRTEIGHREQHIKNLQDQLMRLQDEIDKLKKEIEAKILEIKQAHKQASHQMRMQEDKLTRQGQQALDNLTADHLREQQELLSQFNSAQEMLKDKISGLQIELEEAQERYAQRESRPEDLELIESLRCEVSEREGRIKDLIDEKRFYQLELVNRETNFNKVFNTAPNVGVLNPFQKPKKKGDITGKMTGGPGLSVGNGHGGSHQRLDPLPGSPMHDGRLNPAKPLPQPNFTKKFVK